MSEVKRHPDFERIRDEFIKYYGKEDGISEYKAFLKALNLDETKNYAYSQREKFSFLKPMLKKLKEDKDNAYYRVLVGFPLKSMNDNLYTKSKLSAAAGSLVNAFDCNVNHMSGLKLPGVRYIAADFEDGAVEAVLRVPKAILCDVNLDKHTYAVGEGRPLYELIDEGIFYNQSLEASEIGEFHFVGSALLTKDTLPGIPLSKIMPLESMSVRLPTLENVVSEALSASQKLKGNIPKITIRLSKEAANVESKNKSDLEGQLSQVQSQINDLNGEVDKVSSAAYGTDDANRCAVLRTKLDGLYTKKNQIINALALLEGRSCPAGQHWDVEKGSCVPDEGAAKLQGTTIVIGKNVADDSKTKNVLGLEAKVKELEQENERLRTSQSAQVISSLNVKASRAESDLENLKLTTATQIESTKNEAAAKVKGAELRAANAEKAYTDESLARQKAEGKVEQLEKTVEKLEKVAAENNKGTIQDGSRIKDLERRLADVQEKNEQLKTENEQLAKKHGELDEKHREQLKKNMELSKELTVVNEELLKTSEKAEKAEEGLKKAKRMAKITVQL